MRTDGHETNGLYYYYYYYYYYNSANAPKTFPRLICLVAADSRDGHQGRRHLYSV